MTDLDGPAEGRHRRHHEKVFAGERAARTACACTAPICTRSARSRMGARAQARRPAYFNVNQHVNYTNVCNKLCRFCAFQRLPGQEGAYVMKPEEVAEKIREQRDEPVTEVHMVAGIYPKLPYEYYLDIIRAVKAERPSIHVKAFTMIELIQIARRAKAPRGGPPRARVAGLGSCPGGGAEVFADRVRDEG